MHAIERYGLVALLFLVVTVVAVLMWDGDKKGKGKEVTTPAPAPAAAASGQTHTAQNPAPNRAGEADGRLALLANEQPGPLQRVPSKPRTDAPAGAALSGSEGLHPGGDHAVPEGAAGPDSTQPAADLRASGPASTAPSTAPHEQPAQERPIAMTPKASEPATHAYVVRSSDTLSEIAERELGSSRRWQEIVSANPGLDPARLQAGKTIRVPGAGAAKDAAAPARGAEVAALKAKAPASPPASGGSWKVGKGENLWKIAERALGDGKRWPEIAALNPRLDPDRLHLGQVLVLPAKTGAPSKASTTPASGAGRKSSAPLVASAPRAQDANTRRTGKVK